ncbi:hypothetical protein A3J61_00370 [Candidatus Nomurabacteria bacterium RIFCSPHIGHO2_02_FULL_38_15]|uniref:DUF4446 domain-containing protein n=1 Tax=Candidatus Nomurabacteria bacterium RIFCSPHIGHO2_02_FULL_38_15 TaxID=1801752 RepID=A0A1F6VRY6_9BACT|nr:MAG: hypothetical protein A3J61_00370 [Candidatus Nomurabacteria bacterium RIFCSPHIGHO2_02_FULL_38_15]
MLGTELIIIIAIGTVAVLTLILHLILYVRLKKLFKGGQPKSIDEILTAYRVAIEDLYENFDQNKKVLSDHENRIKKSITTPKTIRFNAWGDVSGNQSFTTRLLDENGNGVIVSTLYAREKTSVFAKPVNNWSTEQELSDEEKELLNER